MTRNLFRGCLFGGAVFAAGITPDASAQTFDHIFSRASAYAQAAVGASIALYEESNNPLGVGTFVETYADFYAYCSVSATRVKLVHERASSGTFTYSGCETAAIMMLDEDITAEVSWDLGAWGFSQMRIVNYTDPTPVVEFDSSGVQSGSLVLNFQAGETITVTFASAGTPAGGDSFGCLEIPIPCAADLNEDGVLNIDDIDAFVNLFVAGCP